MLKKLRSALARPTHDHAPVPRAPPRACEECGSRFSLRVCSTCGHVGCCDTPAGHARSRFRETGHPVMRAKTSLGSGFIWCYTDDRYVGERDEEAA